VKQAHRHHAGYAAFLVHRVSGLALIGFLPFHFWTLGLALNQETALNAFLGWTEAPLVKLSETLLVVLLGVHLAGGLRVLAIEFLPWGTHQKTLIGVTGAVAFVVGLLFLLNAY